MKRTFIIVRTQFVGFHKYENAPDEVAFLKNTHRHLFKVSCELETFHNDRELEFFMVHMTLEREILPFVQLKLESCEQMASRILDGLINAYGTHRYYSVVVSEDGENDGKITYSPDIYSRVSGLREEHSRKASIRTPSH